MAMVVKVVGVVFVLNSEVHTVSVVDRISSWLKQWSAEGNFKMSIDMDGHADAYNCIRSNTPLDHIPHWLQSYRAEFKQALGSAIGKVGLDVIDDFYFAFQFQKIRDGQFSPLLKDNVDEIDCLISVNSEHKYERRVSYNDVRYSSNSTRAKWRESNAR